MMMESFPRGGGAQQQSKKHKTGISASSGKSSRKRSGDDILFGVPTPTTQQDEMKKLSDSTSTNANKRLKTQGSQPLTSTSLLPLGGGAVVHHTEHQKKNKGGSSGREISSWIEGLSFSKLGKGMKLLAVVREVHKDVVVFSLPNLWTGFMLRQTTNDDDVESSCARMVSVGQYLSVVIVKAVQEATANGPKRRIQVCCRPSSVNPPTFEDEFSSSSSVKTMIVRGQVRSVEDHGVLVDLGHGRRGFLNFSNIEGDYSLDENDDDDGGDGGEGGVVSKSANKSSKHYNPKRPSLAVGRILNFVMLHKPLSSTKKSETPDSRRTILSLSLPSHHSLRRQFLTWTPNLSELQPGMLVHATVEAVVRNGLCVAFLQGVYRGAIEVQHLGGFFVPPTASATSSKHESTTLAWRELLRGADGNNARSAVSSSSTSSGKSLGVHVFAARILVVDPATKIIRLSLQSHLLDLETPPPLPPVGSVIENCKVIRVDAGVGALLALPTTTTTTTTTASQHHGNEDEVQKQEEGTITTKPTHHHHKGKLNTELWKNDAYQHASRVQAVYVHISKAMDPEEGGGGAGGKKSKHHQHPNQGKTSESVFAKQFSPLSTHAVRILSTSNWMDGIASGATATSVVTAHVLTHADLVPGKLYRQVTVCAHVQKGGVGGSGSGRGSGSGGILVDFGMGILGLIPPTHLFDKNSSSASSIDYRSKMKQVMYAVGAEIDVRVLTVDVPDKKCMLTAKKALVKAPDDAIISSYESINIGQHAVGFVSKIDSQGLAITFFNGVYGRVTSKSLLVEMGMKNPEENYQLGDVVTCRVTNVKRRAISRGRRRSRLDDEDEMEVDEDVGGGDKNSHSFWELTLSLKLRSEGGAQAGEGMVSESSTEKLRICAGAILPLRSLRINELVKGKEKKKDFVPGYAIVSIKSKYLLNEEERSKAPEFIECKLPYDQLLDEYNATDIESAEKLDLLAEKLLQVGKKINRKGLVLTDPQKLVFEYTSGIGRLAVVSVRPRLVETAETQAALEQPELLLPGPESHIYIGATLLGYVAQVDRRHGAFVRFLNGLTGLIPKSKGGLDLPLFGTVKTKIVSIDVDKRPKQILLASIAEPRKIKPQQLVDIAIKPGDIIKEVEIVGIDFNRAELKILDESMLNQHKYRARLHVTMAKSKSLRKPLKRSPKTATEQNISDLHPFFGLTVGANLYDLRVVMLDVRKDTVYIDLTNISYQDNTEQPDDAKSPPHFIDSVAELTPGQTLSGIVTTIDAKRGGLFLQISPSVSGFIPGLELSEDPNVLNNLANHFGVGCRLDCVHIDREAWRKNLHKYDSSHSGKEAHLPFFSFLRPNEKDKYSGLKPDRGQTVVGRINHSLLPLMPPCLMLELRNGFVGRCCITELMEPDDWKNMPLGATSHDDHNDLEHDPGNSSSPFGPYPSGQFVLCRVLERIPSKPVVEVSLRSSRIEGDLEDDELPVVGELAHAYVVDTNKKGCFLRLSRKVEGRVALKELCNGFLSDPSVSFPRGRLVVGKVKNVSDPKKKGSAHTIKVEKLADLDLRESVIAAKDKLTFDDIEIGRKYKGTVNRIEDYGVFVRLENSGLSGLVHKSECSDNYIKKLSALYDPGDLVKVLVLKKDTEKKQLGFSMKASHFQDDPDSEDDSDDSSDDEDDDEMPDNVANPGADSSDNEMDSEDENFVSKLASKVNKGDGCLADDEDNACSSSSSGSSSSSEERESDGESSASSSDHHHNGDVDDDSDDEEIDGGGDDNDDDGKDSSKDRKHLDTNVGFDWGGMSALSKSKPSTSQDTEDSDDGDSSDEEKDETGEHIKSSHKSRRKHAQRVREEHEILQREMALADGTADANPETAADFERLLAGNPNSSELWIKYMAFHLSTANIIAAKEVADRAFERISFRQEGERLNVWCALLTLELKYGSGSSAGSDKDGLQTTIDRACQHNNPKLVYLRVCEMLAKEASAALYSKDSTQRADDMFAKMCKKFKGKKKVWLAHIEYLLKSDRSEEAHALSKKALLSLPPYKHVETMSKVAQLVFEYGNPEQARTLFDGLLCRYPKRLDLFSVYVDKEVKHGDIDGARALFERQVSADSNTTTGGRSENNRLKLTDKQMKSFFKKWYAFEEQHGSAESRERVKDAARAYVEQSS